MQAVTLDCDVAAAMLPIFYDCYSDEHVLSYCAAAFSFQSCPTLIICDAYTVPNLFFSFSMHQTRARAKKGCKARLWHFFMHSP